MHVMSGRGAGGTLGALLFSGFLGYMCFIYLTPYYCCIRNNVWKMNLEVSVFQEVINFGLWPLTFSDLVADTLSPLFFFNSWTILYMCTLSFVLHCFHLHRFSFQLGPVQEQDRSPQVLDASVKGLLGKKD